jgi:quercetin dioxygenase-like cupin family protein
VLQFGDEIGILKEEPAWRRGDRVAKTLVKEGGLSVVLMLMHAGTALHDHQAAGPVTIQCLAGRAVLHAEGRSVELTEGEMAALDGGVSHSVEAKAEAALLVTIAQ